MMPPVYHRGKRSAVFKSTQSTGVITAFPWISNIQRLELVVGNPVLELSWAREYDQWRSMGSDSIES